ncbi:MAG: prephenate dehydrogenase/arogenate dehydrogenase family protein [Caldiserica bacterium]|nr:prephenate dehydrogenase/arogenate dehydrogenase family protein [Caldisericota bacterium]
MGLGRNEKKLQAAESLGIIDEAVEHPPSDTDILVISIPVRSIPEVLKAMLPHISPATLVTDMGSTKSWLVEEINSFIPPSHTFIGSHPFCGSEKQGMEAANPDIFPGSICFITPARQEKEENVAFLRKFWEGVGMRVISTSPEEHDHILAYTSHLPHFVAFTLTNSLPDKLCSLVGKGFLDTTRIARSGIELWEDIFLTNKKEMLKAISSFEKEWREFKKRLQEEKGLGRYNL